MNINVFENELFGRVRKITLGGGSEYVIANDIGEILEYTNIRMAISRYVNPDDKIYVDIKTKGGFQRMTAINIQGVYDLCIHSTMPKAREFQRWITHEVLVDIRNYGLYVGDNAPSVQVQRDAQGRRIAIDFDTNALLGQLEQLKRDIVRVNNKCDILQQDNLYLRRILANEANMYGLSEDDFEFVFQTDRSKYPYMP